MSSEDVSTGDGSLPVQTGISVSFRACLPNVAVSHPEKHAAERQICCKFSFFYFLISWRSLAMAQHGSCCHLMFSFEDLQTLNRGAISCLRKGFQLYFGLAPLANNRDDEHVTFGRAIYISACFNNNAWIFASNKMKNSGFVSDANSKQADDYLYQ